MIKSSAWKVYIEMSDKGLFLFFFYKFKDTTLRSVKKQKTNKKPQLFKNGQIIFYLVMMWDDKMPMGGNEVNDVGIMT